MYLGQTCLYFKGLTSDWPIWYRLWRSAFPNLTHPFNDFNQAGVRPGSLPAIVSSPSGGGGASSMGASTGGAKVVESSFSFLYKRWIDERIRWQTIAAWKTSIFPRSPPPPLLPPPPPSSRRNSGLKRLTSFFNSNCSASTRKPVIWENVLQLPGKDICPKTPFFIMPWLAIQETSTGSYYSVGVGYLDSVANLFNTVRVLVYPADYYNSTRRRGERNRAPSLVAMPSFSPSPSNNQSFRPRSSSTASGICRNQETVPIYEVGFLEDQLQVMVPVAVSVTHRRLVGFVQRARSETLHVVTVEDDREIVQVTMFEFKPAQGDEGTFSYQIPQNFKNAQKMLAKPVKSWSLEELVFQELGHHSAVVQKLHARFTPKGDIQLYGILTENNQASETPITERAFRCLLKLTPSSAVLSGLVSENVIYYGDNVRILSSSRYKPKLVITVHGRDRQLISVRHADKGTRLCYLSGAHGPICGVDVSPIIPVAARSNDDGYPAQVVGIVNNHALIWTLLTEPSQDVADPVPRLQPSRMILFQAQYPRAFFWRNGVLAQIKPAGFVKVIDGENGWLLAELKVRKRRRRFMKKHFDSGMEWDLESIGPQNEVILVPDRKSL